MRKLIKEEFERNKTLGLMPCSTLEEWNETCETLTPYDEPESDTANPLLSLIYAPDEKTGAPKGDVVLYLSPKTDPRIKEFIQANLLSPVPVTPSSGLDDDTIMKYIKDKDETVDSYANRISSMMKELHQVKETQKVE